MDRLNCGRLKALMGCFGRGFAQQPIGNIEGRFDGGNIDGSAAAIRADSTDGKMIEHAVHLQDRGGVDAMQGMQRDRANAGDRQR